MGLTCILGALPVTNLLRQVEGLEYTSRFGDPLMRVKIHPDRRILVCRNNDILQFRSVTSAVAQSPRRTGPFPAMLPKQALIVPTAADFRELDFFTRLLF